MSAPSLSTTVEPAEGPACVYGMLAGKTKYDPPNGQLSLVLTITNNGPSPVLLNEVKVSFVGSPAVSPSSIPASLTINPTVAAKWSFQTANNVILPVPAPGAIRLELSCDGYTDPVMVDLPLEAYTSPAAGGGYAFPMKVEDLADGEYWSGTSAVHSPAGGGTQLFAYDLLVCAYDPATNGWETLRPGTANNVNANYYSWGKNIYAMADGVVRQFLDGMPASTPPTIPSPAPSPVEGNHFYIQHGSDLALYAHLQAGTLNPALTSGPNPDGTGATVVKGQLLGVCGSSGRSSEPHLHIQVNRTTNPWQGPPRPLPFSGIKVLDLTVVNPDVWPPNTDTPWNSVAAQALPSVRSAIWPGSLRLGPSAFRKFFLVLAWAWIIIIGGLMITPDGVECIACGPRLTLILGIVSVVFGVAGLVATFAVGAGAKRQTPRVSAKTDMHT